MKSSNNSADELLILYLELAPPLVIQCDQGGDKIAASGLSHQHLQLAFQGVELMEFLIFLQRSLKGKQELQQTRGLLEIFVATSRRNKVYM